MKKIITALGNNRLNEELQNTGIYEIVTKDIYYKEGILEVLEEFPNVDTIIISELLEGEMTFETLIEEIIRIKENIDIIVFVESKTTELQSFLFKNGIYKIYENNEIELDKFIDSLQDKIIGESKEKDYHSEKVIEKIETFEATGKIIAITGSYNSGKSSIACLLAREYAKQDKKTLIIDFDIFYSSINSLLDVPKYNRGAVALNLQEQIIHIDKKEDALCSIDLLFSNKNTVDYINLEQILQDFKVKYDIILIDTTSNYEYKYLSRILNNADSIVYLTVPSKIELKKSISLLEIFLEDFKINIKKFQIILNKVNAASLNKEIVRKTLREIPITGVVKYDENIEKNIINKKQNQSILIN